jgi:hypothetical protein
MGPVPVVVLSIFGSSSSSSLGVSVDVLSVVELLGTSIVAVEFVDNDVSGIGVAIVEDEEEEENEGPGVAVDVATPSATVSDVFALLAGADEGLKLVGFTLLAGADTGREFLVVVVVFNVSLLAPGIVGMVMSGTSIAAEEEDDDEEENESTTVLEVDAGFMSILVGFGSTVTDTDAPASDSVTGISSHTEAGTMGCVAPPLCMKVEVVFNNVVGTTIAGI